MVSQYNLRHSLTSHEKFPAGNTRDHSSQIDNNQHYHNVRTHNEIPNHVRAIVNNLIANDQYDPLSNSRNHHTRKCIDLVKSCLEVDDDGPGRSVHCNSDPTSHSSHIHHEDQEVLCVAYQRGLVSTLTVSVQPSTACAQKMPRRCSKLAISVI